MKELRITLLELTEMFPPPLMEGAILARLRDAGCPVKVKGVAAPTFDGMEHGKLQWSTSFDICGLGDGLVFWWED